MHILAGILGVLAAIGVWFYRAQGAARGAEAALDAAGHLKGAYNRRKFRKKTEGSVLADIDDPAVAAAVFLVVLASEKGLTASTIDEVGKIIHERTGLEGKALDDALSFASWACDEVADGFDVTRRFLPLWRKTLGPAQHEELVEMAWAVSAIEGEANGTQIALVRRLAEGFDLAR